MRISKAKRTHRKIFSLLSSKHMGLRGSDSPTDDAGGRSFRVVKLPALKPSFAYFCFFLGARLTLRIPFGSRSSHSDRWLQGRYNVKTKTYASGTSSKMASRHGAKVMKVLQYWNRDQNSHRSPRLHRSGKGGRGERGKGSGPRFLPNEPIQLSRRFHARRTKVCAPNENYQTNPTTEGGQKETARTANHPLWKITKRSHLGNPRTEDPKPERNPKAEIRSTLETSHSSMLMTFLPNEAIAGHAVQSSWFKVLRCPKLRNEANDVEGKGRKGAGEKGGKGTVPVHRAIFTERSHYGNSEAGKEQQAGQDDPKITKRSHALGAAVQSFEFKVQRFPKLRNEANERSCQPTPRKRTEVRAPMRKITKRTHSLSFHVD